MANADECVLKAYKIGGLREICQISCVAIAIEKLQADMRSVDESVE